MTDVYLLIDVCENFRDMLNYYGLCRSTILVNAFLYITGVKDDRKGWRGGNPQRTYKKEDANNERMKEKYDKTMPSSSIDYLDAYNFFGLAMCKKLQQIVSNGYIQIWSESDEIQRWWWHGLHFVLDLEYPQEVHDLHRDYPMAPEIITINEDIQSNAQKSIQKHYSKMEARDEQI